MARPARRCERERKVAMSVGLLVFTISMNDDINMTAGRRRKIRCTYDPARPKLCNECYTKGTSCIDQESAQVAPNIAKLSSGEQTYSLRERVAALEHLVGDLVKRLEDAEAELISYRRDSPSTADQGEPANDRLKCSSSVTDSVELGNIRGSKPSPILSLFDNHVVAKGVWTAKIEEPSPEERLASKYRATNTTLRALVPSPTDLRKIFSTSDFWSALWEENHPEAFEMEARQIRERAGTPENPAEVAKMLLCLCTTIDHVPDSFDYRSLNQPFAPKDFVARCFATIERLVFDDDEIAGSMSGLECMFIAAKYNINNGRPRKAWLLYRRAIQFGQLAGLHLQTNRPASLDDVAGLRRLYVWTALACGDRYLSLILGLPYAVPDSLIAPQVAYLTSLGKSDREEVYLLQICLIAGRIIERNRDPDNMSLSETIDIDRKLQELAHQMEPKWWDINSAGDLNYETRCKRLMAQFVHHFVRIVLHMPFMLKSTVDKECQNSHSIAISSSRDAMRCYVKLRDTDLKDPTICSLVDFQVFTSTALMVVHLLGSSNDAASAFAAEEDWDAVMEIHNILQLTAQAPGGKVAAQSTSVLKQLCKYRGLNDAGAGTKLDTLGCRIQVPYFGTIHVTPVKRPRDMDSAHQPPAPAETPTVQQQQQPPPPPPLPQQHHQHQHQHHNPPHPHQISRVAPIEPHNIPPSMGPMCVLPSLPPSSQILEPGPSIPFHNMPTLPNASFDPGFGLRPSDNLDGELWGHSSMVDLHLDQGWSFDWLDMNGIHIQ